MEKHNKYMLLEWGSVSDEVRDASYAIAHMIWNDSKEKEVYYSNDSHFPYIEGRFDADMEQFGFGIGKPLSISYTLYMLDSMAQYQLMFNDNNGDESSNSHTNFDEMRVGIVSAIIGGRISYDFVENIMHELDHVFEYSKGLKKNETLYNKVLNGLKSQNDDVKLVSALIYHCFPHEQDAFVHQFYGRLKQENYVGDYREARYRKSEYRNIFNEFDTIFRRIPRERAEAACKEFGLSYEAIRRYSKFSLKKFDSKLFRAFTKYQINMATNKDPIGTFEHKTRANNMLFEEYAKRYDGLIIKEESYLNKCKIG